jgi:cytochrome b561
MCLCHRRSISDAVDATDPTALHLELVLSLVAPIGARILTEGRGSEERRQLRRRADSFGLEASPRMQLVDTRAGYGWISIALHWLTGILVLVLWFVGSSIGTETGTEAQRILRLHTSIAVAFYLLLWARVIWRFNKGHPGPLPKQDGLFFLIGKYVHFMMVAAIGLMLISGPIMVWASGSVIYVFDWFVIPNPIEVSLPLLDAMHTIHVWSSRLIVTGIALHLVGVYRHVAFKQDGTFTRMLIPVREDEEEAGRDSAARSEVHRQPSPGTRDGAPEG